MPDRNERRRIFTGQFLQSEKDRKAKQLPKKRAFKIEDIFVQLNLPGQDNKNRLYDDFKRVEITPQERAEQKFGELERTRFDSAERKEWKNSVRHLFDYHHKQTRQPITWQSPGAKEIFKAIDEFRKKHSDLPEWLIQFYIKNEFDRYS